MRGKGGGREVKVMNMWNSLCISGDSLLPEVGTCTQHL